MKSRTAIFLLTPIANQNLAAAVSLVLGMLVDAADPELARRVAGEEQQTERP